MCSKDYKIYKIRVRYSAPNLSALRADVNCISTASSLRIFIIDVTYYYTQINK